MSLSHAESNAADRLRNKTSFINFIYPKMWQQRASKLMALLWISRNDVKWKTFGDNTQKPIDTISTELILYTKIIKLCKIKLHPLLTKKKYCATEKNADNLTFFRVLALSLSLFCAVRLLFLPFYCHRKTSTSTRLILTSAWTREAHRAEKQKKKSSSSSHYCSSENWELRVKATEKSAGNMNIIMMSE